MMLTAQLSGLVAGLLVALAVLAAAAARTRHRPVPVARGGWRRLIVWTPQRRRVAAVVGVGLGLLVATRLVAVAAAAALIVWLAPAITQARRRRQVELQMAEAVGVWLLQLRSLLAAGAGLEQAVTETARLQPSDSPLAAPAARLATRIRRGAPPAALRRFAAEVDNHVADAAVALLDNALARQATGIADALDQLAGWAQADIRQRREIDATLAAVRTERALVIGIFAAAAGYIALANRDLMVVYLRPAGQAVLAAILGVAGLCIWTLERMARPKAPPRFFDPTQATP